MLAALAVDGMAPTPPGVAEVTPKGAHERKAAADASGVADGAGSRGSAGHDGGSWNGAGYSGDMRVGPGSAGAKTHSPAPGEGQG